MRHLNAGRKFSRHAQERKALYRNLLIGLFKHGRIQTTEPKAKEIRRHAERLITIAKKGKARGNEGSVLAARRMARRWLAEREALQNLFDKYAGEFATRPGGYTRILKVGVRLGDAAPMAILEMVNYERPVAEEAPAEPAKKSKKKGDEE